MLKIFWEATMLRSLLFSALCILLLSFLISCSGGDGNIIAPPAYEREPAVPGEHGTTACFGLWQIAADKATGSVDVIQLRSADKILNVLGFLEPPPLTNLNLDWPVDIDFPGGTADVGVILKHPIPDPVFMGFDVRGVVFGAEVTNADGYTVIPSPEFFTGVPFG